MDFEARVRRIALKVLREHQQLDHTGGCDDPEGLIAQPGDQVDLDEIMERVEEIVREQLSEFECKCENECQCDPEQCMSLMMMIAECCRRSKQLIRTIQVTQWDIPHWGLV